MAATSGIELQRKLLYEPRLQKGPAEPPLCTRSFNWDAGAAFQVGSDLFRLLVPLAAMPSDPEFFQAGAWIFAVHLTPRHGGAGQSNRHTKGFNFVNSICDPRKIGRCSVPRSRASKHLTPHCVEEGFLPESTHASGGFGVMVPEVRVSDRNLVFCFPCPACSELIPLPAQSALGAIAAFQYYCTYIWPIRFFCQRFSAVREVSPSTIHLATDRLTSPSARPRSLWQIDCECCLESCGRLHSIYTGYERDAPPDLLCGLLINSNPIVTCLGGHPAKFRREHLTAFRVAGA